MRTKPMKTMPGLYAYALEKFRNAVPALSGLGTLDERLSLALRFVSDLRPAQMPSEIRQKFRSIMRITRKCKTLAALPETKLLNMRHALIEMYETIARERAFSLAAEQEASKNNPKKRGG